MSHILNIDKYLSVIRRRTPSIIYYDNPRYLKNSEIMNIIEDIRNKYPLVLCYRVKLADKREGLSQCVMEKWAKVVCYKNKKRICSLDPYIFSEINNLFQTVYNDCVINYFSYFSSLLLRDKGINYSHIHKLYDIKNPSYPIVFVDKIEENTTVMQESNNKKRKTSNSMINIQQKSINNNNIKNLNFSNEQISSNLSLNPHCRYNKHIRSKKNLGGGLVNMSTVDFAYHSKQSYEYKNSLNFNIKFENPNKQPLIPNYEDVDLYIKPIEFQ